MMSAEPPPESESERLLNAAYERVNAVEETAEQKADETLERRPLLARVVRTTTSVIREQSSERVGLAASGAAFWIVISAFPTAIAAVSLFGLVVSPQQVASDLGNLAQGAPSSLGSLVTAQLQRVAASDRAGLSMGLAVSILLAIWSASAGVYNLDRAIRLAYGWPPQSYFEARGRALLGAFGVVIVLGVDALLVPVIVGRSPSPLVIAVGSPLLLLVIAGAVATMYRFSVGSPVHYRALVPGALASAVGVVALIAVFNLYVSISRRYTAVYGVFAGAVIGMVAAYLAVYAILLGAVLNMQLAPRPGSKSGE